ncbi:type I restriction endonuclease subunit R [Leptospira sp. 'Mane']|uniref:type I restriction endonuclease subunit R n=1 Tax=Leptospira sp. 'Mane' TaxID=3387407 RepID=UPI00398A81E1
MPNLSESSIEQHAISLLEFQGYQYIYGPDIAPDGANPERTSFEDVLLIHRLRSSVKRINPTIPAEAMEDAIKQVERLHSPELISGNETFHRMLTEGVNVTYQKDGGERGDLVWLIDFDETDNNDFVVLNQLTLTENRLNKRLDVVLFINGLPLVVMELKNPVGENVTLHSAFKQLQTYKETIPNIFTYNGLLIISDGLEAKAGTISAGYNRFMAWKTSDGKVEASPLTGQLETITKGMLNRKTLLDLLRHFVVFEKSKKEDPETEITQIQTIKKIAAYHQHYAVNRAVDSTLRAAGFRKNYPLFLQEPEHYNLKNTSPVKLGDRKGGVVWHTQGSGKSLSMVFYTGKIILAMDNPTVLVITDRNDLDDQLFDTFASSKQLLRQDPVQAGNREQLKELLKVASGGVVFTTVQKFQPDDGNVYEMLSDRTNIIVIVDEAHRTQYGFKAKTIDDKDDKGNVIGKKIVYGFAKYMRDALPNATYLGFTGTPIENTDVNTPAVFGNYVDIYDIAQAVEDGATVKIYYESRLAKITLNEEGRKLVQDLDDDLEGEDLTETQKVKSRWTQLEALIGSKERIQQVAKDIVSHFEHRLEILEGKAMIITMSRRIAAELYKEIIRLKPEWHSDQLNKGVIKVVMTSNSSDDVAISKYHHTTKEDRKKLAIRMKDPKDELKIVIVRDMWLTGFDVPSLHTLYIDKPMKGHNLMQAIARVNRVYEDKTGGLIVDYLGIASDLKKALSFYSDAGGKGDPALPMEKAASLLLEKMEIVTQMFQGFDYKDFFKADTARKLSLILAAEDHILGIENGKRRFIDEVTALSQAFSIAIPHDKAMAVKEEVSFFQAIKVRLMKLESSVIGKTIEEMETAIKQVIDQALVSEKVVDVFDAAGIKKPNISIFSEDFFSEIKNMKHKNLAWAVLKKLLDDEIKSRMRKNLIQSRSLMEMLENSIRRYHNNMITTVEAIEALIDVSKEIQKMDKEPAEMGLSEYEYAFYTAVANNHSARELMQKEKLRELAIVLYEKLKENASIDWNIKESVKAKLKVIVKRILRQYGYPPDMQLLATETVLKQAELIAEELTNPPR